MIYFIAFLIISGLVLLIIELNKAQEVESKSELKTSIVDEYIKNEIKEREHETADKVY